MRRLSLVAISVWLVGCGTEDTGRPEPRVESTAEPTPAPIVAPAPEPIAVPEPAPEAAPGAPPEIERPYDESADAQAQIDAAVTASAADGKRVLLMFGANWCVWCRRLDWVFQNHPEVSRELGTRWRLVHVDVGARGSSTNRAVAARYGDPLGRGLPCLVVLDDAGGVAHVQETGSLEAGERHDPARVTAFLSAWQDGQGT